MEIFRRKVISIAEGNGKYEAVCPFCGEKYDIGESTGGCGHMIFAWEGINSRPLFMSDDLRDALYNILTAKRISFLTGLQESWETEFKPCDRRQNDPEEWDECRVDAIMNYIDDSFSLSDLLKTFRCSNLKKLLPELVIAKTEENPDGWGCTSVVFSNGEL